MVIDRISYQRVFAIGNYVTERIGLEASLDANDNPQTELEHLKIIVNDLHSATIATLEEYRGTTVKDIAPVEPQDKIKAFKETLDMCKSKAMLEKFKPQVDRMNNKELTQTYNDRLALLNAAQTTKP